MCGRAYGEGGQGILENCSASDCRCVAGAAQPPSRTLTQTGGFLAGFTLAAIEDMLGESKQTQTTLEGCKEDQAALLLSLLARSTESGNNG